MDILKQLEEGKPFSGRNGAFTGRVEPVKQPKETTEIEEVLEEVPVHERKELVPVDKAIKLLTENGYRVSKPILIYEEVTVK